MNFSDVRKNFRVFVVDSEKVYIETVGSALREAGYDVELFQKGEDLLGSVKISPPHIVVTGTYLMGFTGVQIVKEIKALSSEIQAIFMANYAESDLSKEAMEAGAYDVLLKPLPDIQVAVQVVDRLAEKLYLESANEGLFDKLMEARSHQKRLRHRLKFERRVIHKPTQLVDRLSTVKDTSEAVEIFLDHASRALEDLPILFFRYLQRQSQFVLSHAVQVPLQRYRGVVLNVSSEQLKADDSELRDLVGGVFEAEGFHSGFLHSEGQDGDQIVGLFVFLKPVSDPLIRQTMYHMLQIFELVYSKLLLRVKLFDQTIKDEATDLYLRSQFLEKCEQEVSRARRIQKPASFMHIVVDQWDQLVQADRRLVLAHLSKLIGQTSRTTDIAGLLSEKEIGVLLPHTSKIGAAIKAEKLRRLVERINFNEGNTFVSVSVGVSEYPSLAVDADGLRNSADAACFQIKRLGNKVCLAAAPTGLQPDFDVGNS